MQINIKGELVSLEEPQVMGILNLTPDSFYDGGFHQNEKQILNQVDKMLIEGASFIDIGAYSSRPDAKDVDAAEEQKRLLPLLKKIRKEFPKTFLSIDTFRSDVAQASLKEGADIINDISGGQLDEKIFSVVAKFGSPYIMMHMRGTPKTMQKQTEYDNLIVDIRHYFSERISLANKAGIKDIILDPGFGFAKTRTQNFELMRELKLFDVFELPFLVGISRKSMIYKTLDCEASEALNGTTALNMFSLQQGAKILRVHDVKEAVETVELYKELSK